MYKKNTPKNSKSAKAIHSDLFRFILEPPATPKIDLLSPTALAANVLNGLKNDPSDELIGEVILK